MNRDQLERLLSRGEEQDLDWKADVPGELRGGSTSQTWDKGRAVLLKDLVALANGLEEGVGYLVYGVKDHGSTREVLGRYGRWDDADFQTWAENTFDPPPVFSYTEIGWSDGVDVGVFEVRVDPRYPHVVRRSLGEVLCEGQVWTRHGTKNSIATAAEIRQMVLGPEPVHAGGTNERVVADTIAYYEPLGWKLALPRFLSKDSKILEGWTPAHYPGTRREIQVFRAVGQPDLILMKRPAASGTNAR